MALPLLKKKAPLKTRILLDISFAHRHCLDPCALILLDVYALFTPANTFFFWQLPFLFSETGP